MKPIPMQIDLVSDIVCPWCAIGFGRLRAALEQLKGTVDATITWHPFELNPNMPIEGENLRAHLAAKYGTTPEGSRKARANLTALGRDVGVEFKYFDEMKMLNTHQCHQLLLWAKDTPKQTDLALALFELFFTQGKDFIQENLLRAVDSVGLDSTQALVILQSNGLSVEVNDIQQTWHQYDITGVPAYIINGQHLLVGAVDVEGLVNALTSIAAESSRQAHYNYRMPESIHITKNRRKSIRGGLFFVHEKDVFLHMHGNWQFTSSSSIA